jgi:four helix bundle protein
MENPDGKSPLREKSFNLALRIVKLYNYLTTTKNEYVLSKQVLRSGTSPGAMVREAQHAESSSDFIHKLSIGLKELGETEYWLELLYYSGYINETEFHSIQADTNEVGKMLTSSIKTKKRNLTTKIVSIAILVTTILYFLI